MAAIERPWRGLGRGLRYMFTRQEKKKAGADKSPRGAAESVPIGGLILSAIPGLGHAIAGRFQQIVLWWLLWLALFVLAIALFATPPGWTLLGLAAACHAYIALEAGMLDYLDELGARVIAILLTTALVAIVYAVFARWPLNLRFVRVPFDVPAYNVCRGDLLVFRALDASTVDVPSGTIVLSDVARVILTEGRSLRVDSFARRGVGQVVGGDMDRIAVNAKGPVRFFRNEELLDPNEVPVPRWLQRTSWMGVVPSDHYFVAHAFQVAGRNMDISGRIIKNVCMVPAERIHREAVMVWWPLQRRHRLP